MKADRGYSLGKDHRMKDVLAIEAELLSSEGIDPTWPGFEGDGLPLPTKRRDER